MTPELMLKATRVQPSLLGLMYEDTVDRRQEWGEELYRIAQRLSLTAAQYETIEAHYEALQDIMSAATNSRLADAHIFIQGSIRARTAILPHPSASGEHAEVDADAVVWLPNAGTSALDTYALVEERLREGTRTQRSPSRKNRCVRLHYRDDSPPFHMDVTPARNAAGNEATHGHGHLLVPDSQSGQWKSSAPIGYGDWFATACNCSITMDSVEMRRLPGREELLEKATQEQLPGHESYLDFNPLRAVVKLLKAHRDTMFLDPSVRDLRPISIILTTLAARAYEKIARESVIVPRRAADALIEIVDRMPAFIEGMPGSRVVKNPVIESENFAEKWQSSAGADREVAFYTWHREAAAAIRLGLYQFVSAARLQESMRAAFGPRAVPATRAADSGLTLSRAPVRAPGEQFIEEMFPMSLRYQLSIDCDERRSGTLLGRLRKKSRTNRYLPYGRQLRFFVVNCTVPLPYKLYWKVRNVGPAAERRNQVRGKILPDGGRQQRDETTNFSGEHYVEAYVVKHGMCVARDRIAVPISSQ